MKISVEQTKVCHEPKLQLFQVCVPEANEKEGWKERGKKGRGKEEGGSEGRRKGRRKEGRKEMKKKRESG